MSSPARDVVGDAELAAALAESQRLGMLGDRPVAEVIEHAGAFVLALAEVTGTVVDLGSGGGVPGLVIARARPDLRVRARRPSIEPYRSPAAPRGPARPGRPSRGAHRRRDHPRRTPGGPRRRRRRPGLCRARRRRSGPPRRSCGRVGSSSSASRPEPSPTAGPTISSTDSDSSRSPNPTGASRCSGAPARIRNRSRPSRNSPSCSRSVGEPTRRAQR